MVWSETEPSHCNSCWATTGHLVPKGTVMHEIAESVFVVSYVELSYMILDFRLYLIGHVQYTHCS